MALSGMDFALIVVLVAIGCALSYAGLWITLRLHGSARHQAMESQVSALGDAVKALEARLAELGQTAALPAAPADEAEAPVAVAQQEVHPESEEVSPETLVVIAAAVTAYLGKKVRIRSAKMLRPSQASVSPWSQQGRVTLHGSHHPRQRG